MIICSRERSLYCKSPSSPLQLRVAWYKFTDVLEMLAFPIISVDDGGDSKHL
jgi:hypothetical protein